VITAEDDPSGWLSLDAQGNATLFSAAQLVDSWRRRCASLMLQRVSSPLEVFSNTPVVTSVIRLDVNPAVLVPMELDFNPIRAAAFPDLFMAPL